MTKASVDFDEMATRASSPSFKDRKMVFNELIPEMVTLLKSELSSSTTDFGVVSADLARLLDVLLLTIPRYVDKRSRSLVLNTLDSLYEAYFNAGERGEKLFAGAIGKLLLGQSQSMSTLASAWAYPALLLLAWTSRILALLSVKYASETDERPIPKSHWKYVAVQTFIKLQAKFLDAVLEYGFNESYNFIQSAVKYAQQPLLRSPTLLQDYMSAFAASGTTLEEPGFLPLFGAISSFAAKHQPTEFQQKYMETVLKFYQQHAIASRIKHRENRLELFAKVFQIAPKQLFIDGIFPSIDKLLLRSPEVAMAGLFVAIKSAGPMDLSAQFGELSAAIINQMKSSNEGVRNDALQLWKCLAERSANLSPADADHFIPAAVKLLGDKFQSTESKCCVYTALGEFRGKSANDPSFSSKLLEILRGQLSAETNETVLKTGLDSLAVYLTGGGKIAIDNSVGQFMLAGSRNSKESIRLAYMSSLQSIGESIRSLFGEERAVNEFSNYLKQAIGRAQGPSAQSSFLEAFLAVILLMQIGETKTVEELISAATANPQANFIFAEKTYLKSPQPEDLQYLAHGWQLMIEAGLFAAEKTTQLRSALMYGLVWIATECGAYRSRQRALSALRSLLQNKATSFEDDLIGLLLVQAVKKYLQENGGKPSEPSEAVLARLRHLVRELFTTFSSRQYSAESGAEVEQRLLKSLLIVNHPLVSSGDIFAWPALVNSLHDHRSDIDPTVISSKHCRNICDSLFSNAILFSRVRTSFLQLMKFKSSQGDKFNEAARNALATMVFLQPDIFIPIIIEKMDTMIETGVTEYHALQAVDLEIWQSREDSYPVVNVLAAVANSRSKQAADSGSKDRATAKWEQELRAELEAKRSAAGARNNRQLSKAEQTLVQSQLLKERQIRSQTMKIYDSLRLGLYLVDAMIRGNSAALENYLPSVLESLFIKMLDGMTKNNNISFESMQRNGWDICEETARCLVRLFQAMNPSFFPLTCVESMAMAVIRWKELPGVSGQQTSEDLVKQTQSLISDVGDLMENQEFSTASFIVWFQFFEVTLQRHKFLELSSVETVLNLLAANLTAATAVHFPRARLMKSLLLVMADLPKLARKASHTLSTFCSGASELTEDEEMRIVLDGLLAASNLIRQTCLQCLEYMEVTEAVAPMFATHVWTVRQDGDEEISRLARQVWDAYDMEIGPRFRDFLIPLLVHAVDNVRSSAAKAIGEALKTHSTACRDVLQDLFALYNKLTAPPTPRYDEYGVIIKESLERPDNWKSCSGVALALHATVECETAAEQIKDIFEFLLIRPAALGDENELVRRQYVDAGLALVEKHGRKHVSSMLTLLDVDFGKLLFSAEYCDRVQEGTIVITGACASHLDPTDPRVTNIVQRLISLLKTPSEAVQQSVAECLPAIIKPLKEDAGRLLREQLDCLLTTTSYAERRGAAYGLAAIIKSRGISALKEFGIINALKTAMEDKKSADTRQGAVFAIETMSAIVGRLFEPYIIQLLPYLLVCFGDNSPQVREATIDTARILMSNLSAHCVKLILPSVLAGLEDSKWRAKVGSIELLGSMAYCAPKQLSISLPTIVPRLVAVLADSHINVQKASKAALERFTDVIQNPEIKQLAPKLLNALGDPTKHTGTALNCLIDTSFEHYIDGPSLAIVIPIVERGMRERSTELKKKAALIVGSMTSLTESKDLSVYLQSLIPLIRDVLIDPSPEPRAIAAKSLGLMVEKLGEHHFPTLLAELVQILKSDSSAVDRQGSAQALAEVLYSLGVKRLDQLLPEIVANTESVRPSVRDGFMTLLVFLPVTFGDSFQKYLGETIPCALRGLADEYEYVRDSSLKAAKVVIDRFGKRSVELLLPSLETGLFDDNWRIRQSSVQLLGDLLYKIAGISGNAQYQAEISVNEPSGEEDMTAAGAHAEQSKRLLAQMLGAEKLNEILAALYVIRSDVNAIVRQSSLLVWKAIVQNTPRTMKEVLPQIIDLILLNLAAISNQDRQHMARETLNDLVQKLGHSFHSESIPRYCRIIESPIERPERRAGALEALLTIMEASSEMGIEHFDSVLVPAIHKAVVDPSDAVRKSAARCINVLQAKLGQRVTAELLPELLLDVASPDPDKAHYALEALKELMSLQSGSSFSSLLPKLLRSPINSRALAALIPVIGPAVLNETLLILRAVTKELEMAMTKTQTIDQNGLAEALGALFAQVSDVDDAEQALAELLEVLKSTERVGPCAIAFSQFCQHANLDRTDWFADDWIQRLIGFVQFTDDDKPTSVAVASWDALNWLVKRTPKEDYPQYIYSAKKSLRLLIKRSKLSMLFKGSELSVGPLVSIYLAGITQGDSDAREDGSKALAELITFSDAAALKPFVMQIVGALIRVSSSKLPSTVQAAVLLDIGHLLEKVSLLMKPFVPQLQRVIVLSLSDEDSSVREAALFAFENFLNILKPPLDPLMRDLKREIDQPGSSKQTCAAATWLTLGKHDSVNSPVAALKHISETLVSMVKPLLSVETPHNLLLALVSSTAKLINIGEQDSKMKTLIAPLALQCLHLADDSVLSNDIRQLCVELR